MIEPGWITFYEAARDIHERIGGSLAEAQMKLRRACGGELIRTRKAPYDEQHQLPFDFWTRVAPREWRKREVDYDGPNADGCKMVPMIHEDDFRQWLDKIIAAVPPLPGGPVKRAKPKRELAKRVIADLFPQGVPTREVPSDPDLCRQVQGRLPGYCKENNIPRPVISDDTILRAAGRKKQ
jgi:hypothetical protein